jgi:hypothetical protein
VHACVWSAFTWLRIGTIGRLSWMQWWTFGFWCQRVSELVSYAVSIFRAEVTMLTQRDYTVWQEG